MKSKKLTLLMSLALAGCVATNPESSTILKAERKPNLVIEFGPGSASFNNAQSLTPVLQSKAVLFLINGNKSNKKLSDDRLSALLKFTPSGGGAVYSSFVYTDRLSDENMVEVFALDNASQIQGVLAAANQYSLASKNSLAFVENEVRQYEVDVGLQTYLIPGGAGQTATDQLLIMLQRFGWGAKSVPVFVDGKGKPVGSKNIEMDIVLLDEAAATQVEMQSILETWLSVYGFYEAGYNIAFDRVSKKVVIVK